jgi:hypothetical protein
MDDSIYCSAEIKKTSMFDPTDAYALVSPLEEIFGVERVNVLSVANPRGSMNINPMKAEVVVLGQFNPGEVYSQILEGMHFTIVHSNSGRCLG